MLGISMARTRVRRNQVVAITALLTRSFTTLSSFTTRSLRRESRPSLVVVVIAVMVVVTMVLVVAFLIMVVMMVAEMMFVAVALKCGTCHRRGGWGRWCRSWPPWRSGPPSPWACWGIWS